MNQLKIVPERDGFHHLVFVGLKSANTDALHQAIARLQSNITTIVETADTVLSCAFYGNAARFEDELHFGFHAVFVNEAALDIIRVRADHRALMQWFSTVSNGKRMEINATICNGVNAGSHRLPGHGLLSPMP